jgi:hypothetical protein
MVRKTLGQHDIPSLQTIGIDHAAVPHDNQDERPATIKMRMAPGVG